MKPHLPSPGRLTRSCQYQRVYKEGRLARGEAVWLYLLPSPEGEAGLGVSISSSIIRKAAQRSRLKRVIKEWFRQDKAEAAAGYQAVVVVKKDIPAARAALGRIRQELTGLLEKLLKGAGRRTRTAPGLAER